MWNIKVNAICARAHGTGSTANAAIPSNVAFTFDHGLPANTLHDTWIVDDESRNTHHPRRVKPPVMGQRDSIVSSELAATPPRAHVTGQLAG